MTMARSGFVFRLERKRGPVWYAKYRLPDGTPGQAADRAGLDRAWAAAGRPLHEARSPRTGCTIGSRRSGGRRRLGRRAGRAASRGVDERDVRRGGGGVPALRRAGPRLQALDDPRLPQRDQRPPAAGVRRRWRSRTSPCRRSSAGARACRASASAARALEQDEEQPARADARDLQARGEALRAAGAIRWRASTASACARSGDIQVFSPEEVWALVRAAASEADAAIFLTAAFTGLRRGELLGAALARRRLRRLDDPGPRELRRRAS